MAQKEAPAFIELSGGLTTESVSPVDTSAGTSFELELSGGVPPRWNG
jgi:hypothetical protein